MSGEETEIESGDEKVCPKEVGREERCKSQDGRGQFEGGKGRHSGARESRRPGVGCECRSARGWVEELGEGWGEG